MALMKNVERRKGSRFAQVRIRIPDDAQHAFGVRWFTESLNTTDDADANARAAPIIAAVKKRIAEARKANLTAKPRPAVTALTILDPDDVFAALSRWRTATIQTHYISHANGLALQQSPFGDEARSRSDMLYALQQSNWSAIPDFDQLYAQALASQGVTAAPHHPLLTQTRRWFGSLWLEVERKADDFARGDFSNWRTVPESVAVTAPAPVKARTLSDLLDAYNANRKADDDSRKRTYVRRLSEFLGNPDVGQVTIEDMDRFLVALRRFPSSKRPDIHKMAFPEVIAKFGDDPSMPKLSEKTIWANWMVFFKSMFTFAHVRGWVSLNPVAAAMPAKPKSKPQEAVRGFTDKEIADLFTKPLFTGASKVVDRHGRPFGLREKAGSEIRKDAYYWLPILGLWTGCRVEELAAANAADIKQEDGVWIFDLRERTDLKTAETSPRAVPLHSKLIATGFLNYVNSLPEGGRLFPELPHDDEFSSSRNFTKWFGRWMDAAGYPDPKLRFHSWRHTLKQAMKGRMPEDIHDYLTGHKNGSIGRGYGGAADLKVLAAHMEKVDFPTLPKLP